MCVAMNVVEYCRFSLSFDDRGSREVMMGTSQLDRDRLLQGEGAVFSLRRAAELLPGDRHHMSQWLRQCGLVSYINGRPVVVWRSVLDFLVNQQNESIVTNARGTSLEPVAASGVRPSLRRVKLDPI